MKSPSPETPRRTSPETKVKLKGMLILRYQSRYNILILIEETKYKVLVRCGSVQQSANDDDDANLYMVIVGVNGQTKKMPLVVNKKGEIEFTTTDVGQVSCSFIYDSFIYIKIDFKNTSRPR